MALVKDDLEKDLKKVFSDMKDAAQNSKDDDFSKGISDAVKKFAEAGTITTVDKGTVSGGTYAGSGSGTLSLDASLCKKPIDTAMEGMKDASGDATLASAIASGIQAMTTAGEIDITSSGTLTPPPPAPTAPMAGSGSAKLTCVSAPLIPAITAAFASMKNMTKGGDDFLAGKLATAIDAYYKAGKVTGKGSENLEGVSMSGNLS